MNQGPIGDNPKTRNEGFNVWSQAKNSWRMNSNGLGPEKGKKAEWKDEGQRGGDRGQQEGRKEIRSPIDVAPMDWE